MSSPVVLPTPPSTYNIDDAFHLSIQPEMYMNDSLNDCVIAARAHHTLRLAFDGVNPLLTISDDDVSQEYLKETGGPDRGLNLSTSLAAWQKVGWTIGKDTTMRKISAFNGPFFIEGDAAPSTDPTMIIKEQDLQAFIIANIGAQINLNLPQGITVNDDTSFGPDNPWSDTSGRKSSPHVMLLIGYDTDGFQGITWGQRQHMTTAFLKKYCVSVFFIVKGATT